MYGALKLLYDNLITGVSQMTLSSWDDGFVSGTKKTGTGSARMTVYGPFQGAFDLSYEIVCDSIAAGVGVGSATIKWRTSNTAAGTWEQTGVTTATTPKIALSADGLSTNITLSFVGSVGNDFAVGDRWIFEARSTYGPERLIDRDRNTYWKSTGCSAESIIIDHGSAKNITGVLLQDHNISSGATVKFQANATDSWGSPSYSNTFSSITDPLYLYLDQTYRYNKWDIVDSANTDGYIQAANIMHTVALSLEAVNAVWGSSQNMGLQLQDNESEAGILRRYLYAQRQSLEAAFGDVFVNDDVDALVTMQEALLDTTTHRVSPLWVHLFSDVDSFLRLMDWRNINEWSRVFSSNLINSGTTLIFDEVVKV